MCGSGKIPIKREVCKIKSNKNKCAGVFFVFFFAICFLRKTNNFFGYSCLISIKFFRRNHFEFNHKRRFYLS